MIYIFAGNYQQAVDWARRQGFSPRQVRYIIDHVSLRGVRGIEYVRVGNWYDHKDVVAINRELDFIDAKEVAS